MVEARPLAPDVPVLACSAVSKSFGGTTALDKVDLDVSSGKIVGLIGPNGSGKSTLLNVISGFYRPDSGAISMEGASIVGRKPHELRIQGISRTFQNIRVCEPMTVAENVMLGLHLSFAGRSTTYSWLGALAGLPGSRRHVKWADHRISETLAEFGLSHVADVPAREISYGLKRRLELARAMVLRPRLLLLDEPTAGLPTDECERLLPLMRHWVADGEMALLLVEHRLDWIVRVADTIIVLDAGVKIAEGSPQAVISKANVIKAYIGE